MTARPAPLPEPAWNHGETLLYFYSMCEGSISNVAEESL
jgi:hypothetical protein